MRLSIPLTMTLGAIVLAAACGGGQPAPPPVPAVDSTAIRDSIARAEAARRAREDSIRRAQEAERLAAQRRADSLAAIARATEMVKGMVATRIHFDFDKSNIRPGDATILDQKVAILQANPMLRISITGHCDERGSDEYNLALGNRRALAAKQYMVNHGISADRISTASRGEEDPIDPAHNEAAWEQNRRDEFGVTAGGEQLKAPSGM
jgi:peptidoglycan-associated lipoprotein